MGEPRRAQRSLCGPGTGRWPDTNQLRRDRPLPWLSGDAGPAGLVLTEGRWGLTSSYRPGVQSQGRQGRWAPGTEREAHAHVHTHPRPCTRTHAHAHVHTRTLTGGPHEQTVQTVTDAGRGFWPGCPSSRPGPGWEQSFEPHPGVFCGPRPSTRTLWAASLRPLASLGLRACPGVPGEPQSTVPSCLRSGAG